LRSITCLFDYAEGLSEWPPVGRLPFGSLDDDARGRLACCARGDRRPDVAGNIDVAHRMNAGGFDGDNRASVVGGFANLYVERDLAEIWNSPRFGITPRAAVAEYRGDMVAGRATEARHVFDQSQQRYVDFLKHRDGAPRIDQRDVLRRRDNDCAGERRLLRHGELRVAGARRQIDDENIEIAPRHFAQHLCDGRYHHRPAPNHGEVFFDQEANRHHLDAKAFHRLQRAWTHQARFAAQTEQLRLRGTINIGVEDAGFQPKGCEGEREIA